MRLILVLLCLICVSLAAPVAADATRVDENTWRVEYDPDVYPCACADQSSDPDEATGHSHGPQLDPAFGRATCKLLKLAKNKKFPYLEMKDALAAHHPPMFQPITFKDLADDPNPAPGPSPGYRVAFGLIGVALAERTELTLSATVVLSKETSASHPINVSEAWSGLRCGGTAPGLSDYGESLWEEMWGPLETRHVLHTERSLTEWTGRMEFPIKVSGATGPLVLRAQFLADGRDDAIRVETTTPDGESISLGEWGGAIGAWRLKKTHEDIVGTTRVVVSGDRYTGSWYLFLGIYLD